MANFGKLNFSTSLNPTSAFPLDARCYFDSLEKARAAAATAEDVGSTNTTYYFGMKILVSENDVETWYEIRRNSEGIGYLAVEEAGNTGGTNFTTDDTLELKDGILKVNTANIVEQDNTLPITSAAVYTEIGNINALLRSI